MPSLLRPLVPAAVAVGAAIAAWSPGHAQPAASDPFRFLAPSVVVSPEDRARLDADQVLVRVLPGRDGQLAVFAASRLDASPETLVAWTRAIAELKRSKSVPAIGRFSDPPLVTDLAGLTLDPRDVDAIRQCRPGDCGLRLSAEEITSLNAVSGGSGTGWREAVQQEFRRLLVQRVLRYRAGGLAALDAPADRRTTRNAKDALSAIVQRSPYLARLPSLVAWLTEYPRPSAAVESFFYWSTEQYGAGKPVISMTHVGIVRPDTASQLPAVLVAGKQIFASHYLEGGLGVTMVTQDAAQGTAYLIYVNRSQVDVLRGFLGVFVRGVFEDRVERQAPAIVRGLRARLESGMPPEDSPRTR